MSVRPGVVRQALRDAAGTTADGVWIAPGRVNLIGEHTDYNDGYVLPMAIDRNTAVAAARRDDSLLRCWSMQRGEAPPADVPSLAALTVEGWWAYVHGVVWALREHGVDVPGLDIAVDSDVPLGAGLSSSAALESAVALAVCDLAGVSLSVTELARAAQRAEWEWAGTPCGVMDQTVSVGARDKHVLLLDTRSLEVEHVPLDLAGAGLRLLVIDTKVAHRLRDGGYAARRRECEEAAAILRVPALRDATADDVDASADRLGERLTRRARHVVTENARVLAVADVLRTGRVADVGPMLDDSHLSLRDDFQVSVAELDLAVDSARCAGAVGARMTGGGFGGSAIALVPAELVPDVAVAVRTAFATAGHAAPEVFSVQPSPGARRVA